MEDLVEKWVEVDLEVEQEMMKFGMEVIEFLTVLCHCEAYENEWVLRNLVHYLKILKLSEMGTLD